MADTHYNRVIRKLIVGFGDLFNNITLVRYNTDKTEQERFIIPIAYAPKERYVQRLESDPDLNKKVQMALPRLSYEMTGFSYDASRKQNSNIKNFTSGYSQYNPVPYNFDFSLYLYVRNIEDGTQAIEHILPFFTPDYTIKLNLITEMGLIKEIPIVLNSTTHETTYEGNMEADPRMIIWTLNFTVKGFIFGAVSSIGNIIKHSITNIYNDIDPTQYIQFTMSLGSGAGKYKIGEVVYQGYSPNTGTATAKVVSWDDTHGYLVLTQINGNFLSSLPIKGLISLSSYVFTEYNFVQQKYAKIDVYPNPSTANVGDTWTANTIITEYK